MGAEPWSYFVRYQENVRAALEALKQREFEAGRYEMVDPDDPPSTIEEAVEQMEAEGTATVLDMIGVAEQPHDLDDWGTTFQMVAPLAPEQLIDLFGTDKPTRQMIESNNDFYELIDRGLGIYIVAFDGDVPSELFFAGYSFD